MLSGCDQIFKMEIARLYGIEQREVASLAAVKPGKFRLRTAGRSRDEFRPSVVAAIQNFQQAKSRFSFMLFDPCQELLKMLVGRQGARLVHNALTIRKRENHHGTAATVSVAGPALNLHDFAGVSLEKVVLQPRPVLIKV